MHPDKDLFFKAVEQSANMVIITDKKGNIEYLNPKFEEITEYTLEEVRGKKTSILKSGQMLEEIYKDLWDTITSGNIWRGEIINKTKTGNYFWVNVSINPVLTNEKTSHYVAIYEVITERKLAEEVLMEYKEQFKTILQTNLDAIAIFDEDGSLVQGNTALERIFGYSIKELTGVKNLPLLLLAEDQYDKYIVGWKIFFKTGESSTMGTISEWIGKHKDGTRINLELSISPIKKYRNDELKTWIVAIIRDITTRKLQDEKIKKQTEELSEFAHNMSHDLRSHLQNIQLQTYLLKDDPENYEKFNAKIVKQTNKINELLTRSVKLAEAGLIIQKEDKINLKEILEDTLEVTIPKDIKIDINEPEKMKELTIKCDKEKLIQVFKNIFENTVKHSQPKLLTINWQKNSDLAINIKNDGKIISENVINQFNNKKAQINVETRNGIGLTIIRKIIEAHGWEIQLRNDPNPTYKIIVPENDTN
ncbi:MAG: Nitrogen fixation regulatory protein [Candidatus Heimdallarchaeota archaeon LC_3]|nr:MAG: Nitrogen fixation regulatory protein [Candidatus Heimdallarchaeota archaeon LC_3]